MLWQGSLRAPNPVRIQVANRNAGRPRLPYTEIELRQQDRCDCRTAPLLRE
jgi:hypothetical protein